MLFTDAIFASFFLACFAIRWVLRRHSSQKLFLLLCNAVFYGAWDARFLLLMGGYILVNHWFAWSIFRTSGPGHRRALVWTCVALNLAVLCFFKYYNFFVGSAVSGLRTLGLRAEFGTLDIILPIGISFITFQAISYVVDVYRRELEPAGLLDFAVYKSFFPQLVAGPIVRASQFLPQLATPRQFKDVDFRSSIGVFFIGYLKKACIADNIAPLIDPIFAAPATQSSADLLFAALGYSVQIYCDFSGYSDMAIGSAGVLGYRLMQNFDGPYLSTSVREFWRRWHISLSTWLRDYLYIPLGGGRGTALTVYRNLMVTMVLGGLWHGASFTFVLWGAAHGLALCLERLIEPLFRAKVFGLAPFVILGWALTLAWVVLCFVLFRCDSVTTFVAFVSRLVAGDGAPTLSGSPWSLLVVLAGAHACIHWVPPSAAKAARALPAPVFALLLGLAVSFALLFTPLATAPFIYFQF